MYSIEVELSAEAGTAPGWGTKRRGREVWWFFPASLHPLARAELLAEMNWLGFSLVTESGGAWYFSKPTE